MHSLRVRLAAIAVALVAVVPQSVLAGPLTAESSVSNGKLAVGDVTEVVISVTLEPGWHVNSNAPKLDFLIATALEFELPAGMAVIQVTYPEPVLRTLRFLPEHQLELYEGTFQIRATLEYQKIAQPAPPVAMLRYQACNDTVCMRPAMERIPLDFEAVGPQGHAGPGEDVSRRVAGTDDGVRLPWVAFSTEAYDAAHRSRAPFVIEFAAEWCAPCKEMQRRTFRDADVVRAGEGMMFLSVDMTDPDDYINRVLRSFSVIAAPTTVFFDSRGKEFFRKGGFIGPEEFAQLLRDSWKREHGTHGEDAKPT